jgi:hypothetical protein
MKGLVSRWLMSAALVLTSTLVVFGAEQPAKVGMLNKSERRNVARTTKAVQQGKGGGITPTKLPSEPNASRALREEESEVIASTARALHAKFDDSAFRK